MNPASNLSEHFTLGEMTRTQHRVYAARNMNPPENLLASGRALCETLMEPIRVAYNGPVIVHSGYRMPELNNAIGGAKGSQHMLFEACDFHIHGWNLESVWEWIHKESGLHWGQLMLEGWNGHFSWVHISLGKPWRKSKCQQVLTMMNGKYTWVDEGV